MTSWPCTSCIVSVPAPGNLRVLTLLTLFQVRRTLEEDRWSTQNVNFHDDYTTEMSPVTRDSELQTTTMIPLRDPATTPSATGSTGGKTTFVGDYETVDKHKVRVDLAKIPSDFLIFFRTETFWFYGKSYVDWLNDNSIVTCSKYLRGDRLRCGVSPSIRDFHLQRRVCVAFDRQVSHQSRLPSAISGHIQRYSIDYHTH